MDWIKELALTQAEHSILSSGEKLTATHVAAASKLLHGQFPDQNGLQDTHVLMHQQVYTSAPHDFIQIAFVSSGHWACLTNKLSSPSEVDLYDSMHTIPSHDGDIIHQACKVVQSYKLSSVTINVVNSPLQTGGTDCGVYAIAMATDLCHGVDPFTILYQQDEMRAHLIKCFDRRVLSPFPKCSSNKREAERIINTCNIDLYCVCKLPESPPMVCCDDCNEWYHPGCVYIPRAVVEEEDDLTPWSCPACELALMYALRLVSSMT